MTEASVNLEGPRRYFWRWGPPALIALIFCALTVLIWRRVPDILVDFGTQLYVPWQITEGKVLYRDLAYINGPLSPYLNAWWFRLFGVSLSTLKAVNLLITGFVTWMIYFIIKRSCDKFTATLSCITFLGVFAFNHVGFLGIFNFITPYAHELTHGVLLSLLVIIFLSQSINRPRYGWFFLAGLGSGLVFLGKPEVFLAVIAAAAVGMFLISLSSQSSPQKIVLSFLIFGLALLIPISLFFAYLSTKMPAAQALRAIGGGWTVFLYTNLVNTFFHQESLGFNKALPNLILMVRQFIGLTLVAGALLVATFIFQASRGLKAKMVILAVLLMGALVVKKPLVPWLLISRGLPLVTLSIGAVIMGLCIKHRTDREALARLAPLAMWSMFALGLLTKIILGATLGTYGFALAMPGAILLVVAFVWLVPEALRKRQGRGDWFRRLATVFLIVDVICFLGVSYITYRTKDFKVGDRGDAILTYGPQVEPRGLAVSELLKYINSSLPPQANFVVLRTGVMINYLARRPNPTPYLQFTPGEMEIYGEAVILNAFKYHRPDYFIVVHFYEDEHNIGYFGTDPRYGKQIMEWIKAHYIPVWLIGNEPLQDDRFGIKVLKRKESG